jgi:nucleotide-binding universal stress UspA family protein
MMEIDKIVVAYDASEQAARAFAFGLEMAEKFDAELIVISVVRLPEPPEVVETEAILENAQSYYEQHFNELRKRIPVEKVRSRFLVRIGHPAEQIVHLAKEEKAGAIVMGHRGRTLIERWMVGSVAKRVLSYAHCTVCVVR